METINQELTKIELAELENWANYLKFQWTWAFKKFIGCEHQIIALFTGNQCVFQNEYIYTKTGIKLGKDLIVGDYTLKGKINHLSSFEDDLYEVTFQTGIKIKVNKEHPFYWRKYKNAKYQEGWHSLQEIIGKKGYVEFIPSQYDGDIYLKEPKFLGYLFSDGYITNPKQTISFCNNNIKFIREVGESSKAFGVYPNYGTVNNCFQVHLIKSKAEKNPLRSYITSLGIIGKDTFGDILKGKTKDLREFVKGYFNGDGYLLLRHRKNGFGKLPSIEFGFSIGNSRNRAYEFQYILWRLGIYSYIVSEMMAKGTSLFYRVKANTFCAGDLLNWIPRDKYPEKFKLADKAWEKNKYKRVNYRNWISVKNIKPIGRGIVIGYECDDYEVISYCGMRTHNSMKTASCAFQYVLRIMGRHPIPEKNVLYFECPQGHKFNIASLPKDWICPECKNEIKVHERGCKIFRFASEVLPGEKATTGDTGLSAEVKNSVYPEFKKWLPPHFLKNDITYRNMAMRIADPNSGKIFCDKEYKGDDIIVELVAYSQSVQSTAGKQRLSIWEDEEPPYDFHEEQLPRLMAEDGDLLISLTAANRVSWTYDLIFELAQVYIRTKVICDFLTTKDYKPEQIEYTDSPYSIAVIQAASDDNPTLSVKAIESKMSTYDDPDVIATRRYGIHKQVKGRIFKAFDYKIHMIDKDEYFPYGIPHDWVHARGIDYHPQTPWACGCISLSPEDEAFIWCDYNPSPEKLITKEICLNFVTMGHDFTFILNLIDPLSEGIKKDKITVLDDINREFRNLRREGIGTGGYWQTWDTKGEKGRDEIRKRLMNSVKVERPYNNKVTEHGKTFYLPTLWILSPCKTAAKHMKMWRWEEFVAEKDRIQKGEKNKPQDKWSHFNMVWEAIFKHPAWRPRRERIDERTKSRHHYFKGRR